jgi:branched-subunit amino acid aminotransferase/4-amino-4-deoxychorismate lyase
MTQSTSLSTVIDHGIAVTPNNPLQLLADKRNADILVYINGRLLPRESAKISVLDSAVQGGDAVWEGVRVYNGRVFKLDEHIGRLIDSAKAMSFQNVPLSEDIKDAIFRTLLGNRY